MLLWASVLLKCVMCFGSIIFSQRALLITQCGQKKVITSFVYSWSGGDHPKAHLARDTHQTVRNTLKQPQWLSLVQRQPNTPHKLSVSAAAANWSSRPPAKGSRKVLQAPRWWSSPSVPHCCRYTAVRWLPMQASAHKLRWLQHKHNAKGYTTWWKNGTGRETKALKKCGV